MPPRNLVIPRRVNPEKKNSANHNRRCVVCEFVYKALARPPKNVRRKKKVAMALLSLSLSLSLSLPLFENNLKITTNKYSALVCDRPQPDSRSEIFFRIWIPEEAGNGIGRETGCEKEKRS